MELKNLWAMKVLGPKKAMHFWQVLYLDLITSGRVYAHSFSYTPPRTS